MGLRFDQWKFVFQEQRAEGFRVWTEPFVTTRRPTIFNLRTDPFESADHEAVEYATWLFDRMFLFLPAQEYVGAFLATFKEFPPSQQVGGMSLDEVMEKLQQGGN